jgi:hypothetical protein
MSGTSCAPGWRATAVLLLAMAGTSACYVVPATAPDGSTTYGYYPVPPATVPPAGGETAPRMPAATPATLTVRLYPANAHATQTGVISGTVTNMMTGKGRFVVNYQGEVLSGEATRVANDPARRAASTFSLMPPTGSTRPRRLISPVIATSLRTARSVEQRARATVYIATPGARAVLGRGARGHVHVHIGLRSKRVGVDAERRRALDQGQRRLRRFLHHVAELAGEDQLAVPGTFGWPR